MRRSDTFSGVHAFFSYGFPIFSVNFLKEMNWKPSFFLTFFLKMRVFPSCYEIFFKKNVVFAILFIDYEKAI